jgi:hypothetical protein
VRDIQGLESNEALVNVEVMANRPPTISVIPDQQLNLGMSTGAIPFEVADLDGDALIVSSTIGNTAVVKSVTISGTGANRSLVVAAGNTVGQTLVSITVRDGVNAPVTQSFVVTAFALIDAGTASPVAGMLSDRAYQNGMGRDYRGNPMTPVVGVPSDIPADLFRTVSYGDVGGRELEFNIQAVAGAKYTVELYFAEVYSGAFGKGRRVFDVKIDGRVVLDKFDIFDQAGGANRGIVRSFTIESDGLIDIDLQRVVQNPAIAGIRVRPV